MAKLWKCQVTQDKEIYKFPSARVSGRPFVRSSPVYLNEVQITGEILNSPILDVEEVDDPDRPAEPLKAGEIDATDEARLLAEQYGVNLSGIEGTGQDGRILVKDVRTYMEYAVIQDFESLAGEDQEKPPGEEAAPNDKDA